MQRKKLVAEKLFKEPKLFEFAQATALILSEKSAHGDLAEDALTFLSDILRFHSSPLTVPVLQDIRRLLKEEGAHKKDFYRIYLNFFGIAGSQGTLPASYIEKYCQTGTAGHKSLLSFFDIFHHRLAALKFSLQRSLLPSLHFCALDQGLLGTPLSALSGYHSNNQNKALLGGWSFASLAGFFWRRPRSCDSLARVLASFFRKPIEVRPFEGTWLSVDVKHRAMLSRQKKLGKTVLGANCFRQDAGVFIIVTMHSKQDLLDFLPMGGKNRALKKLASSYIGQYASYKIGLRIRRPVFSSLGKSGPPALLGWTSWLGRKAPAQETLISLAETN